jgi:hypothetical protein
MHDWRSYDAIAERYDHVWRGRFEPVGRALWDLLRPEAAAVALDIGTGTGAVPVALREAASRASCSVSSAGRASTATPLICCSIGSVVESRTRGKPLSLRDRSLREPGSSQRETPTVVGCRARDGAVVVAHGNRRRSAGRVVWPVRALAIRSRRVTGAYTCGRR